MMSLPGHRVPEFEVILYTFTLFSGNAAMMCEELSIVVAPLGGYSQKQELSGAT